MSGFWVVWIFVLFAVFIGIMIKVVFIFYKDRSSADFDTVIGEFDGISERDGPVPPFVWECYRVSLILCILYLLLAPGIMGDFWNGLSGWSSQKSASVEIYKTITPAISAAKKAEHSYDLTTLASNKQVVSAGRSVYESNCMACHSENAQGQLGFPNLTDNDWIYGDSDDALYQSIANGRRGAMPAFTDILTDKEIEELSKYLISKDKTRVLHTRQLFINKGEAVFKENCAICHGVDASNGPFVGAFNLTDSVWVYGGSEKQIMHSIKHGQDGEMPGFKERLNTEELVSVATYIKSLSIKRQQMVTSDKKQAQIKRGEYLARAGDCIACHTDPEGGETFAGGLAFHTPFGAMYSTNITPHYDSGIGKYSFEDFYKVMKQGKGLHGYLYPAMPYASYKYTSDQDIKDIWAFLQSVQPVDRDNTDNSMMFPTNIRLGLLGWNTLFLGDDKLDMPEGKSEQWQRGKYLVMGLGHCSECHTPRTVAQAMDFDRTFQGNIIEGWQAPNITATSLYRQSWKLEELTSFLKHGYSAKGGSFATMQEVIVNSTGYLTLEDNRAIATYLLEGDESLNNTLDTSQEPFEVPELTDELFKEAFTQPGYKLFANSCGACHGPKGEGKEGIAPHLYGNSMFTLEDPYNLVAIIIRGLDPMYATKNSGFMPMTNFGNIYTDEEIATLVTFTRFYGGQTKPVTAQEVRKVRESLEKSGYAGSIHTGLFSKATQPGSNTETGASH